MSVMDDVRDLKNVYSAVAAQYKYRLSYPQQPFTFLADTTSEREWLGIMAAAAVKHHMIWGNILSLSKRRIRSNRTLSERAAQIRVQRFNWGMQNLARPDRNSDQTGLSTDNLSYHNGERTRSVHVS